MKIDQKFLDKSRKDFSDDRAFRIAQRASSASTLVDLSVNKQEDDSNRFSFNIELPETKIRNQKGSGRCWIFAALNVMEYKLAKKFNLKEYELSQNFIYFYDKLERANYFYNSILETLDEDVDSRLVSYLLNTPMNDGGQWDMIKNIINKYGIVPKNAMPENENTEKSMFMNGYLTKMLRMNAKNLRKAHEEGKSKKQLEKMVEGYVKDFYNAISVAIGTPPEKVDFEAKDKDNKVVSHKGLTPHEFYELIDMDLDEYVSVINAPTKDKPYLKSYTVEHLGNVLEGEIVRYVNVEIEDIKNAVVAQLKDEEPVWFGCDVGQFFQRSSGRLDLTTTNVFDIFNVKYDFSKEDRLDFGESLMTHAMVFTGVEYDAKLEKPLRYKVENSWGPDAGINGHLVMSDAWFDEFMYQVLVNRKHLSEDILKAYDSEPIKLKPWDPMGSLA